MKECDLKKIAGLYVYIDAFRELQLRGVEEYFPIFSSAANVSSEL